MAWVALGVDRVMVWQGRTGGLGVGRLKALDWTGMRGGGGVLS